MKRAISFLALCLLGLPLKAQQTQVVPQVTAVAGIRVFAADLQKSRQFYGQELGLAECHTDAALCFEVNASQKIEVDSSNGKNLPNQLELISFQTTDTTALRQHLGRNAIQLGEVLKTADGLKFFEVLDPEGHAVRFIEYPKRRLVTKTDRPGQVSTEIIHVGYVVQDRTAMDHFYKDVLGFRPYWHGGMQDNETNWVAMQVSGRYGTEWIEYMLNISPNADHHTLGVMNHVSLGVADIQAAKARLIQNGWKPTEEPKIGRDGKWQLNLYDPDDTRVEFMEFKPVQKPCCSEFTAAHPGPQSPSKKLAQP